MLTTAVVLELVASAGVDVELSGGSPAKVVEVAGFSSAVVSGAEDVTPACSAMGSGVRAEEWGAGVYGSRIAV